MWDSKLIINILLSKLVTALHNDTLNTLLISIRSEKIHCDVNVGVDFRNHLSRSTKLRCPGQKKCIFLLSEGDVRMGCWDGILG